GPAPFTRVTGATMPEARVSSLIRVSESASIALWRVEDTPHAKFRAPLATVHSQSGICIRHHLPDHQYLCCTFHQRIAVGQRSSRHQAHIIYLHVCLIFSLLSLICSRGP